MANICSLDFGLIFKTVEAKQKFDKEFAAKIKEADAKNEGVKIAENRYLFDAELTGGADTLSDLYGSVKWVLTQDDIKEFTKYLRTMQIKEFTCGYEENGCCLFGDYIYKDNKLIDRYIDEKHPVWNDAELGADDYFEDKYDVLKADGIVRVLEDYT
jgi:hypothetical protein